MNNSKDELLQAICSELYSAPEDESSFDTFEENVQDLIEKYGTQGVLSDAISILMNQSKTKCWYLSASIISWLVEEGINLPYDSSYLVAALYVCLKRFPNLGANGIDDGNNLVWTIAHSLKGVDYDSDWEPLEDNEVIKHMQSIQKLD
ncbi:hypothetical protein KR51_00020830 [Rubidibacter lacunae KORDI 51-2]|uniref:Uncharacterized protein n=1 Tax=Rubidibacter lacunae KORDI 51-2 TaxID=582515 RepID=U5DLP3_9CHRO|nr:hypothetical protein [Rubidibacter lacunae]ERN41504.1 hypothetical protein KR51_00020830 [Rubidibacter lacunae KORDI 51-2]